MILVTRESSTCVCGKTLKYSNRSLPEILRLDPALETLNPYPSGLKLIISVHSSPERNTVTPDLPSRSLIGRINDDTGGRVDWPQPEGQAPQGRAASSEPLSLLEIVHCSAPLYAAEDAAEGTEPSVPDS